MRSKIEKMRQDFLMVADLFGWTDEDQAEIGAAIRSAIDSRDAKLLAAWAAWLDDLAGTSRLAVICRQVEQRIHQAAAQERRLAA